MPPLSTATNGIANSEQPLPRTPSFRLDRKRALVIGGSSGIGLGAAAALAQAGAAVTIGGRRLEALNAVVQAIQNQGGIGDALPLDLCRPDEAVSTIKQAGPFDILVNSAGLARHSRAEDTSIDDFDAVANLNFRGAYFASQAVAQGLLARTDGCRGGSIINISSQMGLVGGKDRAVYAATKHAVEGMTKSMAIDWGPHGIRVNTICPTFVRTPLTEGTFSDPEAVGWIESKIKLDRMANVTDIMGAVVFLASDAAAMVTGTALLVDGGWTAD